MQQNGLKTRETGFKWQAVGAVLTGLALAVVALASLTGSPAYGAQFTKDFRLEDCTWSSRGSQNPFFLLKRGFQIVLEGEEEDEGETKVIRQVITVKKQTELVTFETPSGNTLRVRTRVVEEVETEDGDLVEVSRNWFARCKETSDIYYFGEDVDDYEDGEIVDHGGAWRAGVDGAQPGIIMPGTFLLGSRYHQEFAPGVAEDRSKHVDMGLVVPTPVGTFTGCVAAMDSSSLDPGPGDLKIYCPGVGIVVDDVISLIEINRGKG